MASKTRMDTGTRRKDGKDAPTSYSCAGPLCSKRCMAVLIGGLVVLVTLGFRRVVLIHATDGDAFNWSTRFIDHPHLPHWRGEIRDRDRDQQSGHKRCDGLGSSFSSHRDLLLRICSTMPSAVSACGRNTRLWMKNAIILSELTALPGTDRFRAVPAPVGYMENRQRKGSRGVRAQILSVTLPTPSE